MALSFKPKSTYKKNVNTQQGLFNQILITKTIPININNIGNNIKETLEKAISFQIEGKCIVEGYIKPSTVEIITFSSGLVTGPTVIFEVVFQCYVCSPVEGMHINCIAKHINKAGIRAEVNEMPSPVVIFIARDHNYNSPLFAQIKENDEVKVRVIGQRFELNDKYISIIAELVENHHVQQQQQDQPAKTMKLVKTIGSIKPIGTVKTASANPAVNKMNIKSGKITVPKKISIAKEISTELAKEIAEEAAADVNQLNAPDIEEQEQITAIVEKAPVVAEQVTTVVEKKPTVKKTLKLKIKK
jgi:DNA-directed RNA polymerase subunit E'/Rpb7